MKLAKSQSPQMVTNQIVTTTTYPQLLTAQSVTDSRHMAHRARSHRGGKDKVPEPLEQQARQGTQSSTSLSKGHSPGEQARRNFDSKSRTSPKARKNQDDRQGGTHQSPETHAKVPWQQARPGGWDEVTYTECAADWYNQRQPIHAPPTLRAIRDHSHCQKKKETF